VRNERNTVTAELEGLSGRSYAVRVWTALPIVAVRGGRLIQTEPKAVEVSFPPGDARLFSRATLQIDTKQDR
jgi:hypothetical protein